MRVICWTELFVEELFGKLFVFGVFLRVICWTELFVEELFGKLFVFGEFFGELFVGQSYLLKSYLESCLCLVSFSEAFYVCALVSLPLFLSLSFFLCVCVW